MFSSHKTKKKPIISLGQACLILLDLVQKPNQALCYKLAEIFSVPIEDLREGVEYQLKLFYLTGIKSKEDVIKLIELKSLPELSKYEISTRYDVVNKDASRRYFESHLAYETLKQHLVEISLDDLKNQFNSFMAILSGNIKAEFINFFASGKIPDEPLEEYGYTLLQLRNSASSPYDNFSVIERAKLEYFFKLSYIAVKTIFKHNANFPLNIYFEGYYKYENRDIASTEVSNRPPYVADNQPKKHEKYSKIRSSYLGILQGSMPLYRDDLLFSHLPIPYPRPPDIHKVREFKIENKESWAVKNFYTAVNPFVSSISGTLLCMLRICKADEDQFYFAEPEKFINFINCYTSALILFLGGHSYYEFLNVLFLPKIQDAYQSSLSGLQYVDEVSFLYDNNETAFNSALADAITYNKQILKREAVNDELLSSDVTLKPRPAH